MVAMWLGAERAQLVDVSVSSLPRSPEALAAIVPRRYRVEVAAPGRCEEQSGCRVRKREAVLGDFVRELRAAEAAGAPGRCGYLKQHSLSALLSASARPRWYW